MLFNSFRFLAFFIVVYGAYLALHPRRKAQNVLLLAASLYFYGSWDPRFLVLLVGSSCIDYAIARVIGATPSATEDGRRRRRRLVAASVALNLTVLGFFKYFNFFVDSGAALLTRVGLDVHPTVLQVVLPIGISFYTFQIISYVVDVYRGQLEAERSIVDFLLFVSFFPHLVAGPIQHATFLLPQVRRERRITPAMVESGLWLVVWGFFKKTVVGDNAAGISNAVFNDYGSYHGLALVVGALAFTVQIYSDFSGYTDIARGISRLMGFELQLNFRLPYFALTPSDFWKRWHISLSTWLRDYLYISLGGNRGGAFRTYRNLFLTMLLGGLWHGAAWNYVLWGAFHGGILIAYRALEGRGVVVEPGKGVVMSPARALAQWAAMFALTVVGWVLFRSTSVGQIAHFLTEWSLVPREPGTLRMAAKLLVFSSPLVAMQLWQHWRQELLVVPVLPAWRRVPIYGALLLAIVFLSVTESVEFIYFQF